MSKTFQIWNLELGSIDNDEEIFPGDELNDLLECFDNDLENMTNEVPEDLETAEQNDLFLVSKGLQFVQRFYIYKHKNVGKNEQSFFN